MSTDNLPLKGSSIQSDYDIEKLKQHTLGDEDLFKNLLNILNRTIPQNLAKLAELEQGSDVERLQKIAHAVKPTILMFDNEPGAQIVNTIEPLSKDVSTIELIKHRDRLTQSLNNLLNRIATELERLG